MVTPLSLLKFRLAQLRPDVSRNEISTGGSVQFQGKRFPVDVDRHLNLLDLRVATRRCFDHFQDIDLSDIDLSDELSNALSFDTKPPSVRLIC